MLVQIELDELNRLVNIEKGLKKATEIIDNAIKASELIRDSGVPPVTSAFREIK